jgi:hypothetical protein
MRPSHGGGMDVRPPPTILQGPDLSNRPKMRASSTFQRERPRSNPSTRTIITGRGTSPRRSLPIRRRTRAFPRPVEDSRGGAEQHKTGLPDSFPVSPCEASFRMRPRSNPRENASPEALQPRKRTLKSARSKPIRQPVEVAATQRRPLMLVNGVRTCFPRDRSQFRLTHNMLFNKELRTQSGGRRTQSVGSWDGTQPGR